MTTRTKSFLAIGGVLVGVNVVIAITNSLVGGTPGGPVSSSYATGRDGLAAYASLLGRSGHQVSRLRTPLAEAELDPRDTVVLLDADGVTRDDAGALRAFVRDGGRLVVGGNDPSRWLDAAVPNAPTWRSSPAQRPRPLVPVPETEGVDRVVGGDVGSWTTDGASLPVLAAGGRSLLSIAAEGKGRALLLASAGPLQNGQLAKADNARLGVALAGAKARRIVFAESYHGYGESSGLGAIPSAWKVALSLSVLAALVLMIARGRRFGPPEPDVRELSPPRRDYVDALATTMARTRDRTNAADALRTRARAILVQDDLADSDLDGLAQRAEGAGLVPAQARSLVRSPTNDAELVAAGQALATLERLTHRRTM